MEPVIQIRNLNHFYGTGALRKQVLFDISVDIYPGEIVILTGPSGSGKTTLLTLSGALRSIEDGSIRILGHELNGADPAELVRIRQNVGFIFQSHNLIDALTASQNVQMSLGLDRLSSDESERRANAMLDAVGLADRVHYRPDRLSGGQKQRVAIARALVRQPQIILADEPTASLDKKSGREVVELLQNLAKAQGCTILLVTHDNRILDVADRIVTLEDGRLSSFTAGIEANTGHMLSALTRLYRNGDLIRHVTRLSAANFVEMLDQVTSEFEQFLKTVDLANQEAVGALFDQMLEAVTLKIREILNAERGTIFIVDERAGRLRSRIAHSDTSQPLVIEIPIGSGIAGHVAATGEIQNIPDPYHHPAFNPEVDRTTGYRTYSILCMPIYDRNKKIYAVAQLLNKNGKDPFTRQDEIAFREYAEPLGVILEKLHADGSHSNRMKDSGLWVNMPAGMISQGFQGMLPNASRSEQTNCSHGLQKV